MTNPTTGRTQALWIHMLENGGLWTTSELSQALGYKGIRIDGLLYQMAQRGFIIRKARSDRENGYRFGVTMDCKPPYGLTLEQVVRATRWLVPAPVVHVEPSAGPPRTRWQLPVTGGVQ